MLRNADIMREYSVVSEGSGYGEYIVPKTNLTVVDLDREIEGDIVVKVNARRYPLDEVRKALAMLDEERERGIPVGAYAVTLPGVYKRRMHRKVVGIEDGNVWLTGISGKSDHAYRMPLWEFKEKYELAQGRS